MRPHHYNAPPSYIQHINALLDGGHCEYPQSPCSPRDLDLLNHTLLDFIRPEVPRGASVSPSDKLRHQYLLAQQAPSGSPAAEFPEPAVGHDGNPFSFAGSSAIPGQGLHTLKNTSSNSSLSASLAAAAAATFSSSSSKQQGKVGLGIGPGMGAPVRDDSSTPPPPMRTIGSNNPGGTEPKSVRAPARYSATTNTSKSAYPSPFSKSKSSPVIPMGSMPSSMPMRIPGGGSPHPGHHVDDDLQSLSPPSTSSSPDSASAGQHTDLSRTWSCNSRPRDNKIGMHRPRHSLSVSIVRRRGNSLASSPVTSGSYSSLNQSPAVSFLASLADMSVAQEPVRGEYHEGDQVGDFLLGPEIGVGAFSHVFEAEVIDGPHKHLGKVAVKVVIKNQPSEEGSKDLQRLIEHETTVWARLRHPHVLEMLELMDADDAVFVVSELVTGGNLLDHIRAQGHLTEENARKIFRQVASALRYLHDEIQVVHRDVKCENILLDSNGNAKLADFGLSADMTPEAPISGSPILPELSVNGDPVFLMGSIHYCAPEELRKTTKCNAASDLWSLGVVLYAMLTGGLPFNDGFMPRLQMMIQNGRWDQAKLDAAGCSAAAKEVVRGLLRPKAAERWGSNELWASDWLKGTSE